MRTYYVFYAGQLYGEFEESKSLLDLPDGAYIRFPSKNWYIQFHGTKSPINLCDIPNEVRVLCLLLDISTESKELP